MEVAYPLGDHRKSPKAGSAAGLAGSPTAPDHAQSRGLFNPKNHRWTTLDYRFLGSHFDDQSLCVMRVRYWFAAVVVVIAGLCREKIHLFEHSAMFGFS
jgi:hypothetical protein